MAYWLLKSEPSVYSWDQLVKDKKTNWSGVRNHSAALNMKAMKKGDLGFFYHSNEGKEIVGIVEIIKTAYPDPSDETGKFVQVDVKPIQPLKKFVTLSAMKNTAALKDMDLIRLSRLSVGKVTDKEWALVSKMGGV